jgi:hypothetical protein
MTQAELNSLVNSLIIDNNTNQITPAKVRSVFLAVIDSIQQTNLAEVSASNPLNYDAFNNVFSIIQSSDSTNGYLSSADWIVFDAKQPLLVSGVNIKTINGVPILGTGNIVVSGAGIPDTDSLAEGSTNLYFTAARVLATLITGVSVASGGIIAATDTVLQALGKLQYQITNFLTDVVFGTFVAGLTAKTTPIDTDFFGIMDSADSNLYKKISYANFKIAFKAFFDLIYNPYRFRVSSTVSTSALTGTTASTFMVSDVLIPAGTVTPGKIITIRVRGIRSISVSSNTGINFAISPTPGQTVVSGDITSIHNYGNMIISGTSLVGQRKTDVFVKATNLSEVVSSAMFTDDTQSSSVLSLTNTDWTVNQYFYIYANNAQTTTSLVISGYELFVK